MSDNYQQDQSGWEWMDQEEERRHTENISEQASMSELAKYNKEFECLLAQFDSHFMIPSKESI